MLVTISIREKTETDRQSGNPQQLKTNIKRVLTGIETVSFSSVTLERASELVGTEGK